MSQPYVLGKLTRTRSNGERYWSFCIIWHTPDGRKRHSLGTTDRVTAEALARKIWANLSGGGLRTVGDVVEAYLGPDDRPRGVPDDKRKREAWAAAKGYWSGLLPETVDEEVSRGYLAWRGKAVNTMRAELSLVRTALNWAAGSNKLDKAPKIVLPAMPETTVGHLTKDDFRKFLAGCRYPHVKLFAMLAVTTGGRKSAILQTKWGQVDWDHAVLNLNPEGRKQNSKFRATVPLNDLIVEALRAAKLAAMTDYIIEHRGQPLQDIKKGIAAASKRSGIYCHPHMFRHSAAVWMAEDRVPMPEIASFLGHRDINVTTRIYARYNPDFLRGAARSLTW
ncbi:tyrosine-type recombinase/integrase [Novosphingobium sp. LASN5T]|uniref:tyrosine-type recombinase/integrase n=1 Tax=Novosphingobium sp. LASN5T TaxID=2491021 RepID=UPI000F5F0625|nr:tyrosine-type recombinase/integrase [Novosphingobium sp. LASN5T]RQW42792.1 site-specific integrase [Novosphingobium sp. LASN5T]